MKQIFEDDNLEQIGNDSFLLINYDEDTLQIISHCDTIINEKHVVIDTFEKNDTLIIEKTLYQDELRIIEKLIDRPDFGKSAVSLLIVAFVLYSLIKKWNCKKKD